MTSETPSPLGPPFRLAPAALLLPLLAGGCPPNDSDKNSTITQYGDADADSDSDADIDTDTDADTDTDSDTEPAVFGTLTVSTDLSETIDVAATETALWAVGFDAAGEPEIVSIDPVSGAVTALFTGAPLVQPTGLTVSSDGATIYVSDLAAVEGDGSTNGEIYSMPAAGGTLTSIGIEGVIDLPGDVAAAHTTGNVWTTGINAAGEPAIYEVVPGGAITEHKTGSPLVDPLAIAPSPDDSLVYVLDSLGQDGSAAIFAFDTAGFANTELASGFRIEFPGGIAVDPTDTFVYYTQTNATGAPWTGAALLRVHTDGTGLEEVSDTTSLKLPAGVAAISGVTYVTDLSSVALGDVFAYAY